MNSARAAAILSRSCSGVSPAAWMSSSSGIEILPSGRTGSVRDIVSFFQTDTCKRSSGPMMYSEARGTDDGDTAGADFVATDLVDACWTPAAFTRPSPARSAAEMANHFSAMSDPPDYPPSAGGGVPLETHVLDLVEEGAVTDLQHLGCPDPAPAALLQRALHDLALGLEHRPPRDLLERQTLGRRERLAGGRRRGHRRRRHQRAGEVPVLQHDHPLDEILELADVAGPPVGQEGLHRLRGERARGHVEHARVALDEVFDEAGDLLAPLAQR